MPPSAAASCRSKDVIRAVVPEAELAAARRRAAQAQPPRARPGRGGLVQPRQGASASSSAGPAAAAAAEAKQAQVLPIRGLRNDVPVKFEEGGAVPGDRIVGVLTEGEGIRIFQIHSPKLKDYEHERWIDVTWDVDPDNPERFPAKIVVTALNEPGTLAQIAQVIGEADGNIDNVRMVRRGRGLHRDADRAGGVGPRPPHPDHHRPQGQGGGEQRRARVRLDAWLDSEAVRALYGASSDRCMAEIHDAPKDPCRPAHLRLGVNIDHVATIRNARGGRHPDPLRAAHLAVEAGADGITAHLREDRRHISDADIARLKRELTRPLNFEMAATDGDAGDRAAPRAACLLPGAGEARGAHDRGRARRRRAARTICATSSRP